MANLNPIKIIVSNKERKVSENEPFKSIAEFYSGLVLQFVEKYIHES